MRSISLAAALAITIAAGSADAQSRRYIVEIDPTWSTTTHPGAFPDEAHFSHFGGAVHSGLADFWSVGELASPGMKRMAERGSISILLQEVGASAGVLAPIAQTYWFCPPETVHGSCGPLDFEIEVDPGHPLVTLVSMLGPSPDWFVGVDSLPLVESGEWLGEVIVDLHPYDGGTRDNNAFALFGPLTDPPAPISVITQASGQIITPASLGTMRFTLVPLPCPSDLDGDASVGASDLAALVAGWGQAGAGDLDGDGTTGASDLAALLAAWGPCD